MVTQTLTQEELDDAYHLAVFECESAINETVWRVFRNREEQIVGKGVPKYLGLPFGMI